MPPVTISDVYEPLTFAALTDEKAIELNAFHASGIIQEDPNLSAMAAQGGRIGELPNYGPLATTEANVSTDDSTSHSSPLKISSQKQRWRLASLNQSWSTMDLARELALKDPVDAITSKIGQYWATQKQMRLIQSAIGILADNDANDGDDMFVNIANDSADAITSAELISPDAVLNARQTAGDHYTMFSVIAMHSVVFNTLVKQQVIEYETPAESPIRIPFYLNMRVVVDDALPAVAGTNRITYTSIMFGPGAFLHGVGAPVNPSELERIPSAGDGGGQEVLYSRVSEIYHPLGMDFTSASVTDESATLAELATAANWNRIYDRKNIPMAFLKTNG